MSAVILVVLDRPDAAKRVLMAARRLAELTAASRVNVLAPRMPPLATVLVSEEVLTREKQAAIRAKERRRAHALKETFEGHFWSVAPHPAPEAEFLDPEAVPGTAVTEWGQRADFVVLERPWHHSSELERQAIHAALFETDRPALLVPPVLSPALFGRSIAVAWRDDGRTIKAVLAALRWLKRAQTVHVLAGMRDGVQPKLPDIFEEHGIPAQLHTVPIAGQNAFGELLLAKAYECGSDMLVLGAFARHPMRSLVLGGVTRHMLAHADLPVFMRH